MRDGTAISVCGELVWGDERESSGPRNDAGRCLGEGYSSPLVTHSHRRNP